MPLPPHTDDGFLPPSLHAVPLQEVMAQFGTGSEARERQGERLRLVVEAATHYPEIKRVLVWGIYVTVKPEPNGLKYSLAVSYAFNIADAAPERRRFLDPLEAWVFYGVDKN